MRTDYFDDLLPASVTRVTQQKTVCVTPVLGKVTRKNRSLGEASRMSRTSRAKKGNTEQKAKRYAYRFRLHNGEGGGTVLTDEPTLDKARTSLAERYGDRLALVVEA